MITASFAGAEKLLYGVALTKVRLSNYERKLSKAIRRGGPSSIQPIDLSKPVVQGSRARAGLDEQSDEIARLSTEIQRIKDETGDVLTTVSQLNVNERRLIEMWYIKRRTKREIADALHYSATKSVYALREKAITHFIELYPW